MMTLRQFAEPLQAIPAATSWYLADLGQALGKQELFTRQSPQKLKVLREHALIESAVSSNRIELAARLSGCWPGPDSARFEGKARVRAGSLHGSWTQLPVE
jgi:hypothetical protein